MPNKKTLSDESLHNIFLFGCIGILLWLVFKIFEPFLTTLFMAAVISTAVYPTLNYLEKKNKWPRVLNVLIIFIGVILLIIIPTVWIFLSLLQDATNIILNLPSLAYEAETEIRTALSKVPILEERVNEINLESFVGIMQNVMAETVRSAAGFLKQLSLVLLHGIVLFTSLFFFLLDGPKITGYVKNLIPLSTRQKNELFRKTEDLMKSIIYGIFGGAIAQGIVLGIGLSIVGINNPLFWATVAAFLAPVPYIGVGLVWIPITASLFIQGEWGAGIFLLIWSLVFVANIDNVVKPFLIGARTMLHPFAILLVILGGVLAFGFKGLVFGPLLLTLLLAFLHIYKIEFINKGKTK